MKRLLQLSIALLIALIVIVAVILGPYALRIQHFVQNPAEGYSADFFLYVSPDVKRMGHDGQIVTILVQPNNSGVNSDDSKVHRRELQKYSTEFFKKVLNGE